MALELHDLPHPIYRDEHGVARIRGSRVLLDIVVARYHVGDTPEQIAEGFPTAGLPNIHAALAYYLQNREEVDEYIREGDEKAERNRGRATRTGARML